MAVSIPDSAIRQPSDSIQSDSSGLDGYAMAWKGPYDDLEECITAIAVGDVFEGMTVAAKNLSTIPGGWGLLQLTFSGTSSQGSEGLVPISDKWSIKSCRNDVSVLAYCGKTSDNPNRPWIECWQKETDAEVADANDYTRPDGTVAQLINQEHASATVKLIEKLKMGIESVIRFYPLVVRKRVYSDVPDGCLENLGFIDAPPAPGLNAKKPQGLAGVLSNYQWMKVQDDADQTDRNQWTRTEGWMGILKKSENDSPWDPDLYGPNRWPMPYVHTEGDNNQGGGGNS